MLGTLAVLAAAILGLLAWTDALHLTIPEQRPVKPWRTDARVTPVDARATLAPKGGTIERSGRLTLLAAPGSPGKAVPLVPNTVHWGHMAQPFEPVPNAMLAGVRGLFRLVPHPPDEQDNETLTLLVAEYGEGRLVLVDGCFRMNGPGGPLLVFPPGTRLGLRGGYLMVGPPGLPPLVSARVGEQIFWEGGTITNWDEGTRRRVRAICGPGRIESVNPWSATVREAEVAGFAASSAAGNNGITWEGALRDIERCMADVRRREPDALRRISQIDRCEAGREPRRPVQPPRPPDILPPTG